MPFSSKKLDIIMEVLNGVKLVNAKAKNIIAHITGVILRVNGFITKIAAVKRTNNDESLEK